jgi:cysteine desulfurase
MLLGSACKTGDPEPSDVLLALGLSPKWALGSLRITLGEGNTTEQIAQLLEVLPHLVEQARKISIRN